MQPKINKYSQKLKRELEQCIVSVSEGEENTSGGECETGGDTVITDEYNCSEDNDYGDTEEERNEVEEVESEESDSPTKEIKPLCMRHDGWSVTMHFKALFIWSRVPETTLPLSYPGRTNFSLNSLKDSSNRLYDPARVVSGGELSRLGR